MVELKAIYDVQASNLRKNGNSGNEFEFGTKADQIEKRKRIAGCFEAANST